MSPQDTHNTPHESKERTYGFPLHCSRIRLSCPRSRIPDAGDIDCTKPTCSLNPTAIYVDAKVLVDHHSPHDSHRAQFTYRKTHVCHPWAMIHGLFSCHLNLQITILGLFSWISLVCNVSSKYTLPHYLSSATSSRLCQSRKGRS